MLEGTKSKLGIGRESKTYHSGEWAHPEDVSDPTTFEDEAHESRLDRLGRNTGLVIGLAILGLLATVWFFQVSRNMAFSVVTNRYVHLGVAGTIVFVAGHQFGYSRIRGLFDRLDWLVLASTTHISLYVGEYSPGGENTPPGFQIQRGFTWAGFDSRALTIGDVSAELARMRQKANKSPEDAAEVRLHRNLANSKDTFFGTVIFQLSEGVNLDPGSRRFSLHATTPAMADEDALEAVRDELETERDKSTYYQKRLNEVETDRDELMEAAQERREDILSEFADNLDEVAEGVGKMRGHSSAGRSSDDDDQSSSIDLPSPTDNDS